MARHILYEEFSSPELEAVVRGHAVAGKDLLQFRPVFPGKGKGLLNLRAAVRNRPAITA